MRKSRSAARWSVPSTLANTRDPSSSVAKYGTEPRASTLAGCISATGMPLDRSASMIEASRGRVVGRPNASSTAEPIVAPPRRTSGTWVEVPDATTSRITMRIVTIHAPARRHFPLTNGEIVTKAATSCVAPTTSTAALLASCCAVSPLAPVEPLTSIHRTSSPNSTEVAMLAARTYPNSRQRLVASGTTSTARLATTTATMSTTSTTTSAHDHGTVRTSVRFSSMPCHPSRRYLFSRATTSVPSANSTSRSTSSGERS